MRYLKKFESNFNEPLFQESSWEWFMSINHLKFDDYEYNKIRDFYSSIYKGQILPELPPSKHGIIGINNIYGRKINVSIHKCSDDWYFIRYTNDEWIRYYKCDELEGVFQLLKYLETAKIILN
jgi:hypothetical protein